jgi:hypothetical protein
LILQRLVIVVQERDLAVGRVVVALRGLLAGREGGRDVEVGVVGEVVDGLQGALVVVPPPGGQGVDCSAGAR